MCVYIFSRKKFYTCVLLLLALSIGVVNAQRRIEVTQLRSGAYHANTGRFELTTEQINTEAVIETDLITVANKTDRKSTRLNSSHSQQSRMPSSA